MLNLNLLVTAKAREDVMKYEPKVAQGHVGTHIDLKGKDFRDTDLKGIVIKVPEKGVIEDADLSKVKEGSFVMFKTMHSRRIDYGRKEYFGEHATLSDELIEKLIEKKVALIGIDGPGIKSGKEHPLTDQYLADKGIFVVENLCYLFLLKEGREYDISVKAQGSVNDGMPVEVIVNDY